MEQIYLRFKHKPTHKLWDTVTFIEFKGKWISAYKDVPLFGADFISESSWEECWFKRNPDIYKMIKTNDKIIAKKNINHKESGIAFLAQEIVNGNFISIAKNKIFEEKKA